MEENENRSIDTLLNTSSCPVKKSVALAANFLAVISVQT